MTPARSAPPRPPRARWAVAVAIGLVLALSGCAETEEEPPVDTLPLLRHGAGYCMERASAKIAHRVLTGEEFLAGIYETDLERAQALVYPDDHPRAGALIPFDQWQREQFTAWGLYMTRGGNERPMMEAVYDLMIEEVTPTEFLRTVHEGSDWHVVQLIYPPSHPKEGQFIPRAEWTTLRQAGGWESYLIGRPRHLGCPYGEEPEPPEPRAPAW